jgi:hypothetical protein
MCHGRAWIDIDQIAAQYCGFSCTTTSRSFTERGAAREPLLQADQILRRLMGSLQEDLLCVLRRWLGQVCRMCPDTYIGRRFPPTFTALLCDIVTEAIGCQHSDNALPEQGAHPLQVYSLWVQFGILTEPTLETITAGWDSSERAVLARCSNRFDEQVFEFWNANRGEQPRAVCNVNVAHTNNPGATV